MLEVSVVVTIMNRWYYYTVQLIPSCVMPNSPRLLAFLLQVFTSHWDLLYVPSRVMRLFIVFIMMQYRRWLNLAWICCYLLWKWGCCSYEHRSAALCGHSMAYSASIIMRGMENNRVASFITTRTIISCNGSNWLALWQQVSVVQALL